MRSGPFRREDWPYGRVIAVEEDPAETRANRLQVRRNVEATMQVLNNLGVVIYEWPVNGSSRRRVHIKQILPLHYVQGQDDIP